MAAIGQGQGGEAATQQQGGEAAQQGPDLSQLSGALDGLAQGQQELRDFLQTAPWQQQGQGAQEGRQEGQQEPQAPELDLSQWLDSGELDPQAAQQLTGSLQQYMQQALQQQAQQYEQRFGDLGERISERERMEHAQSLISEFSELGDPQVAEEVVQTASQYAEACGWPSEVASDPRFWRLTYMAGRAAEAANSEGQGSGDPGAAHLEGGGGANPGAGGQVDPADAWIKNAQSDGMGHRALPFH